MSPHNRYVLSNPLISCSGCTQVPMQINFYFFPWSAKGHKKKKGIRAKSMDQIRWLWWKLLTGSLTIILYMFSNLL